MLFLGLSETNTMGWYTPITCPPWLAWERSLPQYYGPKGIKP
jgi:hypothetical protein